MNNKSAGAIRAAQIIDKFGCLPSITPLTEMPGFNSLELAQAIEANLNEAQLYGHTKITIHMDLPDAAALAKCLRERN